MGREINDIDYYEFIKAKTYADRIHILKNSSNQLVAQVQGNTPKPYLVSLLKNEISLTIKGHCTCPAFSDFDECKHIAAVITFGYGIFFSHWNSDFRFIATEDIDVGVSPEQFINSKTPKKNFKDLHEVFLQNSPKNQNLKLENFYASPTKTNTPYKIWYIIDFYESQDDMQIEIKLECQSLLKSGRLGKMKNVAISADIIEHLPILEDKKILNSLSAYARWEYSYNQNKSTYSFARFKLSQASELFLDIIKTNRAIYRSYDYYTGGEEEELKFSDEEAYYSINIDSAHKKITPFIVISNESILLNQFELFNSKQLVLKGHTFYKVQHHINSQVLQLIQDCQAIKLTESDWHELRSSVLKFVPHNLLSGDRFNLPHYEMDVQFNIYLKWETGTQFIRGLIHLPDDLSQSTGIVTLKYDKLENFLNTFKHFNYTEDKFLFNATELFQLCTYANENKIGIYFKEQKVSATSSFSMNVKSGIDWLELGPKIKVDNIEFDLHSVLKNLDINTGLMKIENDHMAIIPEKWLTKILNLQKHAHITKNKTLLHPAKALLLDDFTEIKLPAKVINLKKELQNFVKVRPLKENSHFNGQLRPYQQFALGWFDFLERCHFGGCLADDMGLGKTIQVIAHFQKKVLQNNEFKALIVCPKSLTTNWESEFKRFAPNITVYNWQTGSLKTVKTHITLVSYQLLQRQTPINECFDYLVMDEAQMIKNSHSLTHKAVASITSKNKLALTGTPVENHAGDLMSIFNILIPSLFESKRIKNPNKIDNFKFLMPFILRRSKDEVLKELPEKSIQTIYCEQHPKEKTKYLQYHLALKKTLEATDDITKAKFNLLQTLTKLRQAACHINLIEKCDITSSKIETLKELVQEIHNSNQKVIIFSQFTKLLRLVQKELGLNEDNSCYLDGQTRKRENVIQSFKNDETKRTFLISIKAGGVGLNLTNASYCIILDPWWNPAVEAQAIDRIHRIGQKNPVFAYRLITKGTIEEKVSKLQDKKTKLYHKILDTNEGFIKELSKNDIAFLLS